MKRIGLILLTGALAFNTKASDPTRQDTVVIEFGERSKMVIYAETQEDLKDLEEYDINAMIGELNANLDSTSTETEEVSIVKDSETYLKDSDTESDQSTAPLSYYGDDKYRDTDTDRYERRYDRREYGSRFDDYDDSDYVRINRRSNRRGSTYGTFEMELGMNNWLENGSFPDEGNAAYAVKPWGSWYVGIGGAYHTKVAGPLKLKWGGSMTRWR